MAFSYKGKLLLVSLISLGISLLSTGRTELLEAGCRLCYCIYVVFLEVLFVERQQVWCEAFRSLLIIGFVFLGLIYGSWNLCSQSSG